MVYESMVVVSTVPVTVTFSVMSPSLSSVAAYPGSAYAEPTCMVMSVEPCSVMVGGPSRLMAMSTESPDVSQPSNTVS